MKRRAGTVIQSAHSGIRPGGLACWLLSAALLAGCAAGPRAGTGIAPAAARADSVARAAIANERAIDPSTFPERTVAVAPLHVSASDTTLVPLGWGLADLLTTDLSRSRELRVVERLQMDALMRELGLAASGRVDSGSAPQVCRLVGARQLVTGAIAQTGPTRLQLSTRLADVVRSEVRGAETSTIDLNAILDEEKTLAFSLFNRLGVTLTPAERALVEQRPTRNIAAFLAYSRGVRDEALGFYERAATQYRQALQIDPSFDHARGKLQRVEADIGAAPAPPSVEDQMKRTLTLAGDQINRGALPPVSDASDPSFRASTQQLVTIIIRLTIP